MTYSGGGKNIGDEIVADVDLIIDGTADLDCESA